MNEIKTRLRRIADYIDRKRGKRLTILFRTSDGENRPAPWMT